MRQPTKIALVQDRDEGLLRLLAERTDRPTVRAFDDLYDGFEDLIDFAPDVVFHQREGIGPEDVGALRVLQRALPGARLVLVGPAAREVELQAMADRLGARLLLSPADRRAVAAVLSVLDAPQDQPSPDAFLDLARGISDEVNNPLLFAAGHLQLLETMLDPEHDAEALEQVRASQRGLERIASTMERIRTLGRARRLREPLTPAPISRLLAEAVAELGEDSRTPLRFFAPDEIAELTVAGDARLLAAALRAFVAVAAELAAISDDACIVASPVDSNVRIRFEAHGLGLDDWQLPRAFEPYHLNRVLRGTTHGLSLFLVQTVIHAHAGEALARRRSDGTVLLDLLLPASTVEPPAGS